MSATQEPRRHGPVDDAQGILYGAATVAFAVNLLTHVGLVTGQTAGIAVLISYATDWPFGAVFFVVNLPFYGFSIRRMGWRFTIKTFAAVAVMSAIAEILPRFVVFSEVEPLTGAVFFGLIAGGGMIAIFRHGASLGGIGILAVWLQDRTGLRAGWTQLSVDALVFAAAFLMLPPGIVLYSLAGAVLMNLLIGINHRPRLVRRPLTVRGFRAALQRCMRHPTPSDGCLNGSAQHRDHRPCRSWQDHARR